MTVIGSVVGSIISLYVTLVLFADLNIKKILEAFPLQIFGFSLFVIVNMTLSKWINSPLITALLTAIVVLLSSFLRHIEGFKEWSSTTLLSPTDVLKSGIGFSGSIITGILILIICIVLIYIRPLRYKNR